METFSIIIPTFGRFTLNHTLLTLKNQVSEHDEVIVVGDGDQPVAHSYFEASGLPGFYCHTTYQYGEYGDFARNFAMDRATRRWLMFLDDDDGLMPDALPYLRESLKTSAWPALHLFRMASPTNRTVIWRQPKIYYSNVSSQNIVVSNEPSVLGRWGFAGERGGDLKFIEKTRDNLDSVFMWDKVIVNYNQFSNLAFSPSSSRKSRG